jgi:hypothetical protein
MAKNLVAKRGCSSIFKRFFVGIPRAESLGTGYSEQDARWVSASAMLSGLTKKSRIRAAIALALLYAFCVLAPSAALAFVDGPTAFHCLTVQHGFAGTHDHGGPAHVHGDGTTHHHRDSGGTPERSDADGKSPPGNCCGLFCVSALAGEAALTLASPVHFTFAAPAGDDHVTGRDPDRINRPPIA